LNFFGSFIAGAATLSFWFGFPGSGVFLLLLLAQVQVCPDANPEQKHGDQSKHTDDAPNDVHGHLVRLQICFSAGIPVCTEAQQLLNFMMRL
jgi:hypothetical protein